MPAMATNQTSTDRSTCTTSATRKKSATGSHWLTPGVRDSTSSTENTPEPISASSAEPQPAARQRALRRVGHGQGVVGGALRQRHARSPARAAPCERSDAVVLIAA